jgi:hypothetical protein
MAHRSFLALAIALALAALAQPARAQEEPKPEDAQPPEAQKAEPPSDRRPGANLRVQLVLSRFEGEKKIASLPYTFTVTADGRAARMRMGLETPIMVPRPGPDPGKALGIPNFQYRNVGTNLDCSARDLGDGRYQLQLSVENSSALSGSGQTPEGLPPIFRRFDVSLDPVLRNGQSLQTVTSTDPVTGEVVKIDLTLTVVK